MWPRYRQLYEEVRASYPAEKARAEAREEWLAFLLFRPISYMVTPLFLLAGFSANGVTGLAILLAAALPGLAAVTGAPGYLGVVAGLLVLQVLDCVDGNIARTRRQHSLLGSMLDNLASQTMWIGYFAAVGLLARDPAGDWLGRHAGEIGLALALVFTMQREMDGTYRHYFGRAVVAAPRPEPTPTGRRPLTLYTVAKAAEQPVAIGGLLLAGSCHRLAWLLLGLVVYQGVVLALWLPRQIREIVRRGRAGGGPD